MPSRACIVISSILPLAILAALLHCVHGASVTSNEPMWDAIYGPVVAITNCRVAFSASPYDGEPRLLESMPACVAFTDNGVVTGNDIETQMISDPSNTICGVKSLLGRKWSDPELRSTINGLDYRVVEKDGNPMILANINGTETMMSPERVQGFLFRKMKAIAEQFLEHDVTNIFVPVPSNYNEVQRQAIKNSALEANLTVLRFIKDSSAAITAYGIDRTEDERLVLVYDIGTSGSHASVASIEQGFIEPLGTTTDSFGGEFFTNQVAEVFMADFEQQHKVEGQRTDESFRRLRDAVEEAKQNISTQIASKIEIVDLVGGLSFVRVLTASDFVTINDAYLDLKAVRQLLDDLSLSAKDIDDVILVGGSAHIPEIQNRLEGFFEGKCPLQGISLDDAIVIGTAMQGAVLSAEEPTSACFFGIDSYPLSVGVNTAGGIFKRIIPRKTLLPVRRAQNFTTAVDGQSGMLIQVFEGERMFTRDNRLLGEFVISGIQPEPKGNATIEVAFDLGPYGTLAVIAVDKHTGNKTKMVMDILERDRVLDQGFEMQYGDIFADAEEHADEDQVLREIIRAHLQVDNAIPAPEGLIGANAPQRDEL